MSDAERAGRVHAVRGAVVAVRFDAGALPAPRRAILDGEADDWAEGSFYMAGTLADARAKEQEVQRS